MEALEGELVALLGSLQQTAVVVENFQHGSDTVLAQRLGDVGEALARVDDATAAVPLEVAVPEQMVEVVQRGENPDLYTLRQIDACAAIKGELEEKEALTREFREGLAAVQDS